FGASNRMANGRTHSATFSETWTPGEWRVYCVEGLPVASAVHVAQEQLAACENMEVRLFDCGRRHPPGRWRQSSRLPHVISLCSTRSCTYIRSDGCRSGSTTKGPQLRLRQAQLRIPIEVTSAGW